MQRDPLYNDSICPFVDENMTLTPNVTATPLSYYAPPGTSVAINAQSGDGALLVSWQAEEGLQTLAIAVGNTREIAPVDGVFTLRASGTANTVQLTGTRRGAGSLVAVAPAVRPSAVKFRTASFQRPANTTAYAAGDLVANSVTPGSVAPLVFAPPAGDPTGGSGEILRARIRKSKNSGNFDLQLLLFTAPLTLTVGDNDAWSAPGSASFRGAIDVPVRTAFTDGMVGYGVSNQGNSIPVAAGETLYGYLRALSTNTPDSAETFEVALEVAPCGG